MLDTEALDEWGSDEIVHALLLRLAAEFQGFCRNLHDDCIEAIVAALGITDQRLELIISNQSMQSGRRLDSANATKDTIANDFIRLGLRMWATLEDRFPERVREWLSTVHLLNTARNGIAHDVEAKLDQLRRDGHALSLSTALAWRSSLDGLTRGMDTVCSAHLQALLPVGAVSW